MSFGPALLEKSINWYWVVEFYWCCRSLINMTAISCIPTDVSEIRRVTTIMTSITNNTINKLPLQVISSCIIRNENWRLESYLIYKSRYDCLISWVHREDSCQSLIESISVIVEEIPVCIAATKNYDDYWKHLTASFTKVLNWRLTVNRTLNVQNRRIIG